MKPFPYAAPFPSHRRMRVRTTACVIACTVALFAAFGAFAHGDTAPQAVDTSSLPRLGDAWRAENPYRTNDAAVKVGSSAYNQNCARCHGLEAVSGGIAPDLRKLDNDCATTPPNTRATCVKENDEYFLTTVRHGRSRNGAVYMPPFEGTFDQEAIWAIKAYLETRREKPF